VSQSVSGYTAPDAAVVPNDAAVSVFLSYARADGEIRAAELRDRLKLQAPDTDIKQDRLFLEGGVGWWKQITDAIDSVDFLILLMTPAAIASGNVEKEGATPVNEASAFIPSKDRGIPNCSSGRCRVG
jgi:hypothetical protein